MNIIEVADDTEALEIARTLNEDRRAMPKAERTEQVQYLKDKEFSNVAIAKALKVTEGTVRSDLAELTSQGYEVPDRTLGLDGKYRPSRRTPKLPPADA